MYRVREEQQMTQGWIWSILCACAGLCCWGICRQLTSGIELQDQSISIIYMFLLSAIPFLALLYFYKNKLYTSYDKEGIKIKYFPFGYKVIHWNEIKKIELVQLELFNHAVWKNKDTTIYHAEGNYLLKLETVSEKLLIGTALPNEVKRIVNTYCHLLHN